MTQAYLVLKTLDGKQDVANSAASQLVAEVDHQLIMSDESAVEIGIESLVDAGYLRRMTDEEALHHQRNA